jgi:tape measure domain-containing protein
VEGFQAAAALNKVTTALEAFTGSASATKAILEQTKAISQDSPFRFPELNEAAQKLALFGVEADKIGPSLKVLSDIAAGTGQAIGEIAEQYGRMQERGSVTARDLKALMGEGVPIVGELAKVLGVSTAQVTAMGKAGQLTFPQVQQALINLTSEGGKFAGMSDKMGHTIGASFGRLKDNVTEALGSAAGGVIAALHLDRVIDYVTTSVQKLVPIVGSAFSSVVDVVKSYGAYIYPIVVDEWISILDIAKTVWSGIGAVWNWGTTLIMGHTVSAGNVISSVWSGVVGIYKWAATSVQTAFRVLDYTISHFGQLTDMILIGTELSVVRFANQVIYFFGDAIPYAIQYMSRNWQEVLTDLGHGSELIIGNLANNIVNVFSNLPGLISGKTNWSDVWTPLANGFKSTIVETFKLPDRVKGNLESELGKEFDDLSHTYSQGLSDFLDDRTAHAADSVKGITDSIGNAFKQKPLELSAIPKLTPDNLSLTITPELKRAKLVKFGSADAASSRFDFTSPAALKPTQTPTGVGEEKKALDKGNEKSDRRDDYLQKIYYRGENPLVQTANF